MRKRIIIFTLLFCIAGAGGFYFWRKKQNIKKYSSFQEYYKLKHGAKEPCASTTGVPVHTYDYLSSVFKVDTIFRSMMGPLAVQTIRLNENGSRLKNFVKGPELLWLVGYTVDVVDAITGAKLSDDFLCHNNLDIQNKDNMPWSVNTTGTFARLFTLTEGQTRVDLPQGYGIPMPSNQNLVINSQVLNHNYKDINIKVKQKVTIYYLKESELSGALKPVYQQAVFVTKQVSGPVGAYDAAVTVPEGTELVPASDVAVTKDEPTCCTGRSFDKNYNPYLDKAGRTFTGHWKFGSGEEILNSDVTVMMNLPYDTKVHYIGVHAHPFCTSLELRDKTENRSLFKAVNENFNDKIGLKYIDFLTDSAGIAMNKNHRYELVSTYSNPTPDVHTAMATMFLYLEMK